jgi:hypothetical protein
MSNGRDFTAEGRSGIRLISHFLAATARRSFKINS